MTVPGAALSGPRAAWEVARNELIDSIRSRRALLLLLLYLAGSIAATWAFVSVLHRIEGQLVSSLGLTPAADVGSTTATLWKSDAFRHMIEQLVGDKELARSLLDMPPLALYYGWLSFAFAPLLIVLMSSPRVAEEVFSGSVRFAMFRVSRPAWLAGKFAGQAGQLFVALLVSAAGAWLVGFFRMSEFGGGGTAAYMAVFAVKAWVYGLAFLGLATGVSQLFTSPHLALGIGLAALTVLSALRAASEHFAERGSRIWNSVGLFVPGTHRIDLWNSDWAHLVPAIAFLLALGFLYIAAGYARFGRRDL